MSVFSGQRANALTRRAMIAALGLTGLGLTGCGRRGALEAPPTAAARKARAVDAGTMAPATSATAPVNPPQGPPVVIEPVDADRPTGWAGKDDEDDRSTDTNVGTRPRARGAGSDRRTKPFILDWLL